MTKNEWLKLTWINPENASENKNVFWIKRVAETIVNQKERSPKNRVIGMVGTINLYRGKLGDLNNLISALPEKTKAAKELRKELTKIHEVATEILTAGTTVETSSEETWKLYEDLNNRVEEFLKKDVPWGQVREQARAEYFDSINAKWERELKRKKNFENS